MSDKLKVMSAHEIWLLNKIANAKLTLKTKGYAGGEDGKHHWQGKLQAFEEALTHERKYGLKDCENKEQVKP